MTRTTFARTTFATTIAALMISTSAMAAGITTISGSSGNLNWVAQSRIIGQTPTSAILPPTYSIGGGDALYKPASNKSGTVALIMEYGDGSRFICSGSVLGDGMSIATAGHCVSGGAGTANPLKTTAYFFNGDPDSRTPFQTQGVAIEVSRYMVNPGYTGQVIDQNDIAILRLGSAAPGSAVRYDLYTSNLSGLDFNVAGYGGRSTIGGAFGTDSRTGWLREGDNAYDYAWGDAAFGGFFTNLDVNGENFFGTADIEFSFISDFDNGPAANDAAGLIGDAVGAGSAVFDTGLGAREANIAGGDSGGPGFVDGKLASINSYGLSFGTGFGDFRAGLNSSWGEFSGYVPIFIHTDSINAAMAVPEPASWAMLIAGFGLTGACMRRRRVAAA